SETTQKETSSSSSSQTQQQFINGSNNNKSHTQTIPNLHTYPYNGHHSQEHSRNGYEHTFNNFNTHMHNHNHNHNRNHTVTSPVESFFRRELSSVCTAFSSPEGKELFKEALRTYIYLLLL